MRAEQSSIVLIVIITLQHGSPSFLLVIQTLPPLNTFNPSPPEPKTTFYVYYVFLKINIQIQSRRIEKTKPAWPWSLLSRSLIKTIGWQVEMNIIQQAKLGGLFEGKTIWIRVKGSGQFIELWFGKKEYSIVTIILVVKFWYIQYFFINHVFIYWWRIVHNVVLKC